MDSLVRLCDVLEGDGGGEYGSESSEGYWSGEEEEEVVDSDEETMSPFVGLLKRLLGRREGDGFESNLESYRRQLRQQKLKRMKQEQVVREGLRALLMEIRREKNIVRRIRNAKNRYGEENLTSYYEGDGDLEDRDMPISYRSSGRNLHVEDGGNRGLKKKRERMNEIDRGVQTSRRMTEKEDLNDVLRTVLDKQKKKNEVKYKRHAVIPMDSKRRDAVYDVSDGSRYGQKDRLAQKIFEQIQNNKDIVEGLRGIVDQAKREIHLEKLHKTFDCQDVREKDLVEKLHNVLERSRSSKTIDRPSANRIEVLAPPTTTSGKFKSQKYQPSSSSIDRDQSLGSIGGKDLLGCVLTAVNNILQAHHDTITNPNSTTANHHHRQQQTTNNDPENFQLERKFHIGNRNIPNIRENSGMEIGRSDMHNGQNVHKRDNRSPININAEKDVDKGNVALIEANSSESKAARCLYEISKKIMYFHTKYYEYLTDKSKQFGEKELKLLDFQLTQYQLTLDSLDIKDKELRNQKRNLSKLINKMLDVVDKLKSELISSKGHTVDKKIGDELKKNPISDEKDYYKKKKVQLVSVNDSVEPKSNELQLEDNSSKPEDDQKSTERQQVVLARPEIVPATSKDDIALEESTNTNDKISKVLSDTDDGVGYCDEEDKLDKTGWISDVEADIEDRSSISPLTTVEYVEGKSNKIDSHLKQEDVIYL